MMRGYFVIVLIVGFSSLAACGGASNDAFAPRQPTTSARPLSDVLYNFSGSDGSTPWAGLLVGRNGEYYGTTTKGGKANDGTVYEITAAGKEKVLYSFRGRPDGEYPRSTLIMDANGVLYGTTENGGAAFSSSNCPGLYSYGCGTIFKLTPGKQGWSESVLYRFHGVDGGGPLGRLVLTRSGTLLGTTQYGGEQDGGDGVVFELAPSASTYKETVVHMFPQGSDDGLYPTNGLVSGNDGSLYGTTYWGGIINGHSRGGWGTVFKLTPSGLTYTYSVIFRFRGGVYGKFPHSSLLPGAHGALYGLTDGGGAHEGNTMGYGTVFELVRDGARYREIVLYRFKSGSDGSVPDDTPGLVADQSGNLYGTTVYGGSAACPSNHRDQVGCGTVFKLARSGKSFTESVLYAFQSTPDGAHPQGGVVIDSSGNLLGPTYSGGSSNLGTIFSIAP